jgi:hypothetical protein
MSMTSILRVALRVLPAVSMWLALAGAGIAFEPDTDRVGSDIGSHRVTSALACQKDCFANNQCVAWTFVDVPSPGGGGVCWMKHDVPAPTFATCCVSGVKSTDFSVGNRFDSGNPPMLELRPRYPDPLLCQSECYSNSACGQWSYSGPTAGQDYVCKLFGGNINPTSIPDPNSIIGLRSDFEFDTDRAGRDLPNQPYLAAPDPRLCHKACVAMPSCRSFTFIKPWQRGMDAVCMLKDAVPPKSANGCCISGTVR